MRNLATIVLQSRSGLAATDKERENLTKILTGDFTAVAPDTVSGILKRFAQDEKAIADAAREAEYADRAEERKLKEWATEQDLKMREAEFMQASDDKRLEMILDAVAANVETGVLADLIASYGNTTTGNTGEASSSGSGGGTGGSIVDPFNPDPPNTQA